MKYRAKYGNKNKRGRGERKRKRTLLMQTETLYLSIGKHRASFN
jgi:hypothetical protein